MLLAGKQENEHESTAEWTCFISFLAYLPALKMWTLGASLTLPLHSGEIQQIYLAV
jgi:hypothetical protein